MGWVAALLAPFIKSADVKAGKKIWNGKAEWLNHPVRINGFIPLSREETRFYKSGEKARERLGRIEGGR
jgi:hypothetical protein